MTKIETQKAVFAGGCFWCVMPSLRAVPGIIVVTAGYTGGDKPNPTYEEVVAGGTGHREAVEVTYDPAKISYEKVLTEFLKTMDPTDAEGQFADRGPNYYSGIFYASPEEKEIAKRVLKDLDQSKRFPDPVVIPVLPAVLFYRAEDYHQTYPEDFPERFEGYENGSGRAAFRKHYWSPEKDEEVRKKLLTEEEYRVTQESGTERPFTGKYWDEEREGLYVDIVSGEVLFSSKDKFDAGCGWPSFSKPVDEVSITEHDDASIVLRPRTEVRSLVGDSHLGHVFNDGPKELTGLRYCINSAAVRFILKEKLVEEGYESYLKMFA